MTNFTPNKPIGPSERTLFIIRQIARAYNNVVTLDNGKTLNVSIN